MPLRLLIGHDRIQQKIIQIGESIDRDYAKGTLVLICILKGAAIFHADLARAIRRDVVLEYMGISSYGARKSSSGQVRVTKDLDVPIEGADVLIVEDIVDTGITLTYLMRLLEQRRPKSLGVAALLDKTERRIESVPVRYTGFSIPDEFVVGYGLDHAERYRNLPDVCVLEDSTTI